MLRLTMYIRKTSDAIPIVVLQRILFAFGLLFVSTAYPVERYTEARILQVETGDSQVVVFLQVVSGDAPPTSNGGTNESLNKPMLFVATSATDIGARQHLIASSLLALSNNAVVRFRWDDAGPNANRIMYMLVRRD